ncbi:uncharacterized protein LOC120725164 isoform X2 [Simochromis diagramma]|uniref:uncharacterized protein LOC120725164 isoform X2 n=1 Tax=Simochromis diagramma TaxID=43689 RepID=UPI001A7E2C2F|nr:uncharacterized protein LOC120725164 isoform X2 [Simochromis diagramma]
MMVTFRWIEMFLFFVLMLQFGGVNSGDLLLSFTVRDGDNVTLPCENLINNHHNCDTTVWLFTDSRGTPSVELVNLGQIKEKAKSDRLSVTAECSLVIKKVTAEDVGRYTCRQFRGNPGKQQVTEHKKAVEVTLSCSVWTFDRCKHKVKWIHISEALDRDYSNLKTSESSCSAAVTFLNDAYTHISTYDFNCSVTTEEEKEQLFTFSAQSSGEKSNTATTIKSETTTGNTTKELEIMDDSTKLQGSCWYRLIIVPLGLAALIAAVVVINIWTRAGV